MFVPPDGVQLIVTPAVPLIETCPAPVAKISIDVPTGYATAEFKGIVNVTADAEFISIRLSLSVNDDKVYAADF